MKYADLLAQFESIHLTVVGDVMLDEYVFGSAERISPEAPVMVIRQGSRSAVPGGAANVARNLVALGAASTVVGVLGDDRDGDELESRLQGSGQTTRLLKVEGRPTTRKTRIVANHSHQVLRIDHEVTTDLPEATQERLLETVKAEVKGSSGILMSDYQKGVLGKRVTHEVIELARCQDVPVFANAKPHTAHLYQGSHLITLNRGEASVAAGVEIASVESAMEVAHRLRKQHSVECVAITLGEKGMVGAWSNGEVAVPAPRVEAYDVAGAGDTAVSALALAITAKGIHPTAFQFAVQVAALVVQHVGVAVPNESDLATLRSLP